MIFILEVTPGDADCWSRGTDAEIINVHNILASIFGRPAVASFTEAVAGISSLERSQPCEVRVYRGIEAARAAVLVEADPVVKYALQSEIEIVNRTIARDRAAQ